MTTFLQRLVVNARGGPQDAAPRIEPLLAPRFAATRSRDGMAALQELQTEHAAPVRATVAAHQPEASASSSPPDERAILPPPSVHPMHSMLRNDRPDDGTSHAIASPLSDEPAPSRVVIEQMRKETVEREVLQPVLRPIAIAVPNARMPTRAITAPANSPPSTAPQAAGIEEHSQAITISIGRVEVRNAPTPAPAPARRAPFKPGVSLDAFLNRGKGGER